MADYDFTLTTNTYGPILSRFLLLIRGMDPHQNYFIYDHPRGDQLNTTVRVARVGPITPHQLLQGAHGLHEESSFMLKFTFMVKDVSDIHATHRSSLSGCMELLCPYQQETEVFALSLLWRATWDCQEDLMWHSSFVRVVGQLRRVFKHSTKRVVVPIVHLYSPSLGVTLFVDQGEFHWPTLDDFLKKDDKNTQRCSHVGKDLGVFFAALHSPACLRAIEAQATGEDLKRSRNNGDIRIRPRDVGIESDQQLHQSFVHGDFTPSTVLVGPEKIEVINWGFSGPGQGISGDMCQFLGELEAKRYPLYQQEYLDRKGQIQRKNISALMKEISNSYWRSCDWFRELPRFQRFSILRAAMILYGITIIRKSPPLTEMGKSYIRLARHSVDEMIANIASLRELGRNDYAFFLLFGLDTDKRWDALENGWEDPTVLHTH